MSDVIRTKPHHFVDIITEYGAGREQWQPSAYGHAVHTVAHRVVRDHSVTLEMTSGADDICAPCVHNVDGLCDDTIDTSFRPEAPSSKREWNLIIEPTMGRTNSSNPGKPPTIHPACHVYDDRSSVAG